MDCSTQVLLHLPFENELVEQVSKLLLVIASTKNKTRLIKLVNTPSVLSVAAAINNGSMNNSQVSRLNPQSLSSLSASISSLFAAADSQQHFQEVT